MLIFSPIPSSQLRKKKTEKTPKVLSAKCTLGFLTDW